MCMFMQHLQESDEIKSLAKDEIMTSKTTLHSNLITFTEIMYRYAICTATHLTVHQSGCILSGNLET